MKNLESNFKYLIEEINDGNIYTISEISKRLKWPSKKILTILKKLKESDLELAIYDNTRCRLCEPLILLNESEIRQFLIPFYSNFINLEIFASIDSTQDYLQQKRGINDRIEIALAEFQSCGRGRFKREWYSPYGQNIYLSMRYLSPTKINKLTYFYRLVNRAIIKTLEMHEIYETEIKPPNDIMYKGMKIAGQIIEFLDYGFETPVIIGIGINVNIKKTNKISQSWNSMANISKKTYNRNQVVANLINNLLEFLPKFEV